MNNSDSLPEIHPQQLTYFRDNLHERSIFISTSLFIFLLVSLSTLGVWLHETTITKFSEILHNYRDEYRVLVRWSKGQDIAAGCGQLAGQKTWTWILYLLV